MSRASTSDGNGPLAGSLTARGSNAGRAPSRDRDLLSSRGSQSARGPSTLKFPLPEQQGRSKPSTSQTQQLSKQTSNQAQQASTQTQLSSILNQQRGKVKKSPSQLLAEHQASGNTKLLQDPRPQIKTFLNLSHFSHHIDSVVPVDEPLFRPSPGYIGFTNFEGLQTYDAPLSLRNQDNVARRVKVMPPDSSFFEVLPGKGRQRNAGGDKVAPGMEISFIIRFKPDATIDYSYDLVVVTERENFNIPIRATGGSAILDLPDVVDFGTTPVRYESTKTVLMRNVGEKPTKFLLKTVPPFRTSVLDGYLEVESSMQVDVLFRPDKAESYERELVLVYGDGIEAYVTLRGSAENVNVSFSESKVLMTDTFIALSTQNTIIINNQSDVPVDFSWRAFPTIEEEIGQKLKLQVQLKHEENEECSVVKQLPLEDDSSDETSVSSTSDEEDESVEEQKRAENRVSALSRRYRNIAKAIMEDPMFFYDEIFAVEPLSGRIWSKSKIHCTITFTPKAALSYQCVAFCSIVGQTERMPLLLKGQGIGPKAAFSYDELDLGDIFVESIHQYEVDLINQGDIAVNFKLVPNTSPFGQKFTFTPSSHRLEVGGQCMITVQFCPDLLGEFHETFYWDLVGSTSSIPLTFKGHSVSPTFHFDIDRISFGVVSYGFLNSKTLTLSNTSEVPMRFSLRIPGDGRFAQKEFDVIPPKGMLLPQCSQKVQVDFISVNVKAYDLCLVVDLDGVGQELASIPILARCATPSVTFEPVDMLEYGDIFIRYPSHQTLVLHNTSALPAKFQILPQDDHTRTCAEFEPDQSYGSVPPASSHVVTLTLTARKIGPLQIHISIKILGHSMPHEILLTANSIGPIVSVEPPVLEWGHVRCLEPVTRTVKVVNQSVIDAQVRAFMKTKNSLWVIKPKAFVLKPHETASVALTLTIDEACKMSDLMRLVITEGKDITVTVKATGIHTPVMCKESLEVIDFGTQYTTQTISREFLIENRGIKSRKLIWVPQVTEAKQAVSVTEPKKSNKEEPIVENTAPPVFTPIPDNIMMEAKCAFKFQFSAMCTRPGKVSEVLLCQEFLTNERKGRTVFKTELRGNFVSPLLELSARTISFRFLWDRNKPIAPMSQPLTIKNISPLDVKFYIKVQPPFHASADSFFLRTQELAEMRIEFDPAFKIDRVCGVVRQKLTLTYQDHPQKDHVGLVGEVIFPNVQLSAEKLDFGSVLNETTKQLSITMSNPHVLPVDFQWMFLEEQEMIIPEHEATATSFVDHQSLESGSVRSPRSTMQNTMQGTMVGFHTQKSPTATNEPISEDLPSTLQTPVHLNNASTIDPARGTLAESGTGNQWHAGLTGGSMKVKERHVDINQIFDILPIMGRLEPGCSQIITFTYFGLKNQKFEAMAVCQADGGPEYEVALRGQASRLEYRIDKTELDFGHVPYNQVCEKDIWLSNTGKVAYYYSFNLSGVSRPFVVDAAPLTGLINPDEKQKISIRFRPGIPDEVEEVGLLEVAHFEPTRLKIKGKGNFPGVLLSIIGPEGSLRLMERGDPDEHHLQQEAARDRLMALMALAAQAATAVEPPRTGEKTNHQETRPFVQRAAAHRVTDTAEKLSLRDTEERPPRPPSTTERTTMASALTAADETAASMTLVSASGEEAKSAGMSQQVSVLPEPSNNDIDFEVDRFFLCQALLAKEQEVYQSWREMMGAKGSVTARSAANSSKGLGGTRHMKELPAMMAAYYVCDFGHIVLGQSGRKVISIYNCYDDPVSFTINRRVLTAAGYSVMPEKVKKLPAGKSMKLEVTCFRAKDQLEGEQNLEWVIPIKGGPSYQVTLMADFVLPDLVLSSESIDFGRVLVGQVKRMTVKLKNMKAVPVEWEYKAPRSKYGKPLPPWETPFSLSPDRGKMLPGQTLWLTVSFSPNSAKIFNQKLALRIADNPNKKIVSLHGQGDVLRVEVQPSTSFKLGPVLPGDEDSADFFLHNPTDYTIEVYSIDFDEVYIQEEEMLKEYDKYNEYNLLELPVREPGQPTWPLVQHNSQKIARRRDRERRRQELAQRRMEREQRRAEHEKRIQEYETAKQEALDRGGEAPPAPQEENQEEPDQAEEDAEVSDDTDEEALRAEAEAEVPEFDPADYPFRVPVEDRLNVIVFGPPMSGKTSAVKRLAEKENNEGRKVMTLNEIVEWALAGPVSMREEAHVNLRSQLHELMSQTEEQHEKAEQERELMCKKTRQPFTKKPCSCYPFPLEAVVNFIKIRVGMPDCNCGVIFDGFDCKYLASTELAAEAIFTAVPERFLAVGVTLQKQLGFAEEGEVPLGVGVAPMPDFAAENPVDPEAHTALVDFYKEHFLRVQGLLEGITPKLEAELAQLKEAYEALCEPSSSPESPGGIPASPIPTARTPPIGDPDNDEGKREGEVEAVPELSPEELEMQAQREALEKQMAEVEAQIEKNNNALARLASVAIGREEELATEVRNYLQVLEAAASVANENKREALAKKREEELMRMTTSSRRMKFDPPDRQEDTSVPEGTATSLLGSARGPREEERLGTSESQASAAPFTPPINLVPVPVPLSTDETEDFFEKLKADVQSVVPDPVIPLEQVLPPPSFVQNVSLPQIRPPRIKPENFSICPKDQQPDVHNASATSLSAVSAKNAPQQQEGQPEDDAPEEPPQPARARWLIRPHDRCPLNLKFISQTIGNFTARLSFEVVGGVGGNAPVSISATGVTAFPQINADPRNVFMRRVKSKPASGYANKQYVASEKAFDFGPLLSGRDPATRILPPAKEGQPPPQHDVFARQHIENFRITNNSLFKAKVTFQFASLMPKPEELADGDKPKGKKAPAKKKEDGPKEGDLLACPFMVDPKTMELDIDETKELQVCCFPAKEGTYTETLVADVEHNPEPVHFTLCAIGAVPKVNLSSPEVDFDRLLLKQRATQTLRLANVCAVPVKWRLVPATQIPAPFIIDALDGTLAVAEERSIPVAFRADEPDTHKFQLKLQIGDVEDLKPWDDVSNIEVSAEAFAVNVEPCFPKGGWGLDFEHIRVGTTKQEEFTITNKGDYPVQYEVKIRRKVIRELLEVEIVTNDEGKAVLQKDETKKVIVRCTPTHEIQCPDPQRPGKNEEMDLLVYEDTHGELVPLDIPPIPLTFKAFFNSFTVTPPRGLNFGPVKIGESLTKFFEIYNDGIFKFDWFLFDPSRPDSASGGRPSVTSQKALLKEKNPSFPIGPFQITPAAGTLNPREQPSKVEVKFVAAEDKDHDTKIGIHVDGMPEILLERPRTSVAGEMDHTHHNFFAMPAGGTSKEMGFREYLLTGQSCTPGIDTENVQTIFEEQFVARNLEDAIATAGRVDIRAFCEEDRVFSFGPVIVQGPNADAHSADAAKFRITNPKAIPCDVKFDIKSRGGGKEGQLPFELSTRDLRIPPHEYRYVKVRFRPTTLQTYSAVFEALVPEGKDPETNNLTFELQGDGKVPTVSLEGPVSFNEGGGLFNFGKMRVGQSHEAEFTLRNTGMISATARCEFKEARHFRVSCPRSLPLEPNTQHPLQVRFTPEADGDFSTQVRVCTLHNPFEDIMVKFTGQGYVDDIAWDLEDVPRRKTAEHSTSANALPPAQDELHLGEVAVGGEASVSFHISNSAKDPIRFQFPETLPSPFANCLKISPSVGHVLPGSRKAITFVFQPTEAIDDQVSIPASIASIAYTQEVEDWDDSMREVSFTPRPSPKKGRESVASSEPEASDELVKDEPAHRILPNTAREMPLQVIAIADEPTYQCSVQRIKFSPTIMFQSKVNRFFINNTSKIALPYTWRILADDGTRKVPGPQAYSISPEVGSMAAGAKQEFVLRFAPKEVETYACELQFDLSNLSGAARPLTIPLDASALRPWCHFELPTSDYRQRRQSDTPLDTKYQIVEFESLGTRVKNTKRFYALNPTSEDYEFQWVPEESDKKGDNEDPFRCLTKRGTIMSGRKYEMVFEYLPTSVGTHESFWTFQLVTKLTSQSFALVGAVKEPRVGMDTPSLNYGRLLLGAVSRETVHIVNKEHIPFSFSFNQSSYVSEGEVPALAISPPNGVVGPDTTFPVEFTFKPREEKFYNFNVMCTVKRRNRPIVFNVKGEGYKIHTKLVLEQKERDDRLLNPGVTEPLDFGILQVHEHRSVTLRLSSPSYKREDEHIHGTDDGVDQPKPHYQFIWQAHVPRLGVLTPSAETSPYVTVSPVTGIATEDQETVITIEYTPTETHNLDGVVLRMVIPAAPGDANYNLELAGRAQRPNVDFSKTKHDFGPCFVKRGGVTSSLQPNSPMKMDSPYSRLELEITNRDNVDCWLDTTFQKTPYLDVQLSACMLQAGKTMKVPIIFTPRDYKEYRESIEFVINDWTKSYVKVEGHGCPLNLELVSMAMQNVDFGVAVGSHPMKRTVKLVNRSQQGLEFTLHDPDGHLTDKGVSWNPRSPVSLRPKEQVAVEINFAPSYRIAPFKLPLIALCNFGLEVHLLNILGACHTAEVKLSEHSILFGSVVYQSTSVRKVHLHNYGDLGVKFRFEMPPKAAGAFSVEPNEGFAAPHDDVVLQVKFHPTEQATSSAGPKKIRCLLDPSYNHDPIELIVQGKGIELPENAVKDLQFRSEVRDRCVLEFPFPPEPLGKNPTNELWKVNPVARTEVPAGMDYWSVPAEITIPPGGQTMVEITYRPLTMTRPEEDKDDTTSPDTEEIGTGTRLTMKGTGRPRELPPKKHIGKVFMATPDGSAFVINLEGISDPPKEPKRITAKVTCKTPHVQPVEISNWLQESQRFNVHIDLVEPAGAGEEIKLHGVQTFDLPPGLTKAYKFNVYAYREGHGLARLVFTNPKTDEFLAVEVAFEFVKPQTLEELEFHATCRQTASQHLSVQNPLQAPVTFTCEASHPDIRFSPQELVVPPNCEGTVEVIFRPVLAGSETATLRLSSKELGDYPYTVRLETKAAPLEKTMVFKAPLGSMDTVQTFKFHHFAKKPATYSSRIEAAPGHKGPANDFTVETKEIKAGPAGDEGVEVPVDIRFAPSALGEIRALLVLTSPEGGDYKALVVGYAQPPQPQGPIVILSGKTGSIDFQNPFEESVQFSVQCDNPVFVVASKSFKLDSKKSSSITVQFKSDKPQSGRLLVSASKSSTPWIFYLKGAQTA